MLTFAPTRMISNTAPPYYVPLQNAPQSEGALRVGGSCKTTMGQSVSWGWGEL